MDRSVSILGCGWYGLELAKELIARNYQIKGSCTNNDKLNSLKKEGIVPYLINFQENSGHFDHVFFNSDVLIICIPPKRSASEQHSFPGKIEHICNAAKKGKIKSILFISSTSVYSNSNAEITESKIPTPDTLSGMAIIEAERILQRQTDFSTTILRFSGLVGPGRDPGRFFTGKTDLPNGQAPVNLIHLKDCIGLSIEIIEKNAFGYIFNGCTPDHPAKQEFYTRAAIKSALTSPTFIDELKSWKIIASDRVPVILQYKYQVNNWTDWLKEEKL